MSDDSISRKAAINALMTDASYQMVDDWGNLTQDGEVILRVINEVPSAQPEIIHCGDCKYKDDGIDEDGIPFLKCLNGRSYGGTRINDFCSWAERRAE